MHWMISSTFSATMKFPMLSKQRREDLLDLEKSRYSTYFYFIRSGLLRQLIKIFLLSFQSWISRKSLNKQCLKPLTKPIQMYFLLSFAKWLRSFTLTWTIIHWMDTLFSHVMEVKWIFPPTDELKERFGGYLNKTIKTYDQVKKPMANCSD